MTLSDTAGSVPRAPEPGLWNRNFVLLWQGQLVSQLGNQAFAIALMYWLMETTGSASLMGTIMMASMLPGVLLGPIGGTIADRHSRVALIVGSDVVRGVLVLALFACLVLAPGSHGLIIAMLVVNAIVGGVVNAVFMPAIGAAIPDLVPPSRLAAANSLNQFSAQGVVFVGQAIGGVLYRVLGAPLLFLVDGVSYLLSAASEAFIKLPERSRPRSAAPVPNDGAPAWRRALASYRHDTLEGIRFVWQRTGMRSFLLLAAGVNFLVMPILVLLPFFVSLQLGAGPEWYGFLLATLGAGTILGYVLAGALPIGARRRPAVIVAAFLLLATALGTLGQLRAAVPALVAFGAVGVGVGLINIFVMTLFQRATASEMRGRVMGLVVTMSLSAAPLGMGLGGIVGDLTNKNIPLVFGTCGALMALLTVAAASRRPFRRFLATEIGEAPV